MIKQSIKESNPHSIGAIFWVLFAVNYLIMGLIRYVSLPMPVSLFVEVFYFAAIIHVASSRNLYNTEGRKLAPMLGIYSIWLIYATLEIVNTTADIEYGTIAYRWFAEVRNLGYQVVYGLLIYSTIFTTRKKVKKMHFVWGIFICLAVGKGLMQQYMGFDHAEQIFLIEAARTHFVNGIIRYFSFFSDAANYGSSMAASVVVFAALVFSCKSKWEKIFYAAVAVLALYGMMASGTRSAIVALAAGLMTYALLSKNFKAFVSTGILGLCTVGFLMFTQIGQGNSMIRRMRSAFNKNDASLGAREINKIAMKRYLAEVPLGIGAGIMNGDIPPSNKNYFLSVVPPDSTWVYVNIRYGYAGLYCFLFSFFGLAGYGAIVTLRKVKNKEVVGQMAATVSGAMAMTVAGYSNHIMLQYPNCLIFFGSLGIISVAQLIDRQAMQEDEEEARRKLEELQQKEEESLA